jgi:signal transduction histidine kinase/ligand-binding sensor domain-containing protein
MKPNRAVQTFLIWLLCVLACETAFAQRRDRTISQFQHTSWTAREGAPSPIYALAQTTDGYLWMATPAGLYRFDGVRFERYKPSSGQEFRSDNLSCLTATSDGGLWIGFRYGGIDLLKNGRITSYGGRDGLPQGTIYSVVTDKDGTVWAAASLGLARLDGSRWQPIGKDAGYLGQSALSLLVDRAGTLWVASEDALFFLPRGGKVFARSADHLGRVVSIAQPPDDALWLSELNSGDSLRDWTARAVRPMTVSQTGDGKPASQILGIEAVVSAIFDHTGSLWITSDDGVFRVPYPERLAKNRPVRFNEHVFERFTERDGLTADIAGAGPMIEDRDGNIWVGTTRGLDRFREANVVPIAPFAPDAPLVTGETDAWATTTVALKHYLVHLQGTTATLQPFDGEATAVTHSADGVIWLGGPGKLWRYANGQMANIPFPERVDKRMDVQAIAASQSGDFWASIMQAGMYRRMNGSWIHNGNLPALPKEIAVSLFADSSGRTWFGYMGKKMAVVDGDRVRTFSSKDGLQVANVQAISEHGGHIWVGGERGLALFMNDRFQSLTADDSDLFRGISGIVETGDGDLWLNSVPGIIRIPAAEIRRAIETPGYRVHCELFDFQEGLIGTAPQLRPIPTLVSSLDGRLWFSTTQGIVQIDSNHLLRNTIPPSVSIREVDSGGVVYSAPGDVNLPLRTSRAHIEYTAPNLSVPGRVRFRYLLEGIDKDWQDAGSRREAFYTNLRPRRYRFHVIACNEDGVWSDVGAIVDFSIAPAWYQTNWFRLLCAVAVLLVVWVIYRLRVRQIAKAMSARFDERLHERTRMARDLHDTFLQTIQGSKLVADDALDPSTDPTRMRRAMEQLSVWLGRATVEGRAALNSLRTSTTEKNDLAAAFRRAMEECRIHTSMEASLSVVGEAREMHPIVRDEVYRVGYEAIRNACVHSQASQLRVELTYDHDLALRVRDNGVGVDPVVADRGREGHFGLQGMRERADRIVGRLTLVSSAASGTEIKLVVPGSIIYRETTSNRQKLPAKIKAVLKQLGLTSTPD